MTPSNLFSSSSSGSYSDSESSLQSMNENEVCNDSANTTLNPYVGQIFSSLIEAEKFYRSYAISNGFAVKILTSRKHVGSDAYYSRMYACRKAGKAVVKKVIPVDEPTKIKRKRDCIERTMCKARMFVVHDKKYDNWRVSTLELKHNHELVNPSMVDLIETHKNITPIARDLIQTCNDAGIAPHEIMNLISTVSGGRANVSFSDRNIRNVVRDLRRNTMDSNDAKAAIDLLKKIELDSPGKFFWSVKPDDENRIACILWIDSRSMQSYEKFGDVVTFDTTYRTNRYAMPFVPFTGVNHHYESILFGFALIRDETKDTFVWVLKKWLEAMQNKAHLTIITDQDKAMNNVISRVLPSTHHKLCTWHISNKYPKKLRNVLSEHETFMDDFKRYLY